MAPKLKRGEKLKGETKTKSETTDATRIKLALF